MVKLVTVSRPGISEDGKARTSISVASICTLCVSDLSAILPAAFAVVILNVSEKPETGRVTMPEMLNVTAVLLFHSLPSLSSKSKVQPHINQSDWRAHSGHDEIFRHNPCKGHSEGHPENVEGRRKDPVQKPEREIMLTCAVGKMEKPGGSSISTNPPSTPPRLNGDCKTSENWRRLGEYPAGRGDNVREVTDKMFGETMFSLIPTVLSMTARSVLRSVVTVYVPVFPL
jgi:hypothetical protein